MFPLKANIIFFGGEMKINLNIFYKFVLCVIKKEN